MSDQVFAPGPPDESDSDAAERRRGKGVLAWFARNHVAANLLMAFILFAGVVSLGSVRQEVFPDIASDLVTVTVPYLGAAPEEVEQAVNARIEERVADLEVVKEVRSVASEGLGMVTVELVPGADPGRAVEDVKGRVDAIDTFPDETEQPIVQQVVRRSKVLSVAVTGPASEASLRRLGDRVRDEIAALPGVTQVELVAARPYEVSIEVSEDDLRRHGLTFDEVVTAVRRSSLDLPGGSVKTAGGEILLRTEGQAYRGREFEELVLTSRPDGTRLRLGDVATVVDGFAESDVAARFDGRPAVLVEVFRVGDQDVREVADAVKDYVASASETLPEGAELTVWQDDTRLLASRLDTLVRNGRAGLVLVLLVLALFLRLRLAVWVALGIPISFLGAVWMMPTFDVTVNVISLFAFIVVLGIVVDDAIVVGENVYQHHEDGKEGLAAAIDGVQEVAMPVVFSVLTTIAAFAPLTTVPGNTGKVMRVIPTIVILTLAVSLVESLFVLPAHLSGLRHRRERATNPVARSWARVQRGFSEGLATFVRRAYRPTLERALEWRYLTVSLAVAVLLVSLGFLAGGHVRFSFFPPVPADNLVAFLTLPQGTPVETTAAALQRIEASARELERQVAAEGEPGAFRHVLTSVGTQPFRALQQGHARVSEPGGGGGAHLGEVNVELAPAETRTVGAKELVNRWRDLTGGIPDAVELSFNSSLFSTGAPIDVQLSGPHLDELAAAAERLKDALARYPGVFDVADSFRAGKEEVTIDVTAEGEALGLGLGDVARQVRQAFYGAEAQRIQRGRDDVRVMVRYPEAERRSLHNLEAMRIRTPEGDELPFGVVAELAPGRGFATIRRTDRQRTVDVTADVDTAVGNANEILADVERRVLPEILADHRGVRYTLGGEQQQQAETLGGLKRSFLIALFVIFALLAIPFRSYLQPLIVMSAIPFGFIGALWGHVLMGIDLTILSGFGIVAVTGVVVNDSLVMVDFINRAYRGGMPLLAAIRAAGERRFRPILLTSLTTFAGLLPLLLERSLQAQFLIPMAISIAFGVLFATAITLIFVPVAYAILEDVKAQLRRRDTTAEGVADVEVQPA